MRALLVSNQYAEKGIANPIMSRLRDSMARDQRLSEVDFFSIRNNPKVFRQLRKVARDYEVVNVHLVGI